MKGENNMNTTRIPDEIKTVRLTENDEITVDTKGLDCLLCADGADVYVALTSGADDEAKFPVKNGTSIDFCGKLYASAKADTNVSFMFYRTL